MNSTFPSRRRLLQTAVSVGVTAVVMLCSGASLAASTTANTAVAAEWPSKPIRFVVPYPPGGPLDIMARMLAEEVREPLGQPVIVENRPGAGGNIGVAHVATAEPDGHTLVMGAVATFAINPWLFKSLPYNPLTDFAPITLVASVPNVLVVNPEFAESNGIKSVQDLIDYAKRNPDKLNYGSGGNGSAGHLAGELLNARAGIVTAHIPYPGAAPAQTALLGGQTHYMFDNLASAVGQIEAGKLIPLAVTSKERSPILPDVPAMAETIPDFDLGTWFGVFAPAGTPPDVVQRLHKVYADALRSPKVRERLKAMGSTIEPNTPEEFAAMVKEELGKYREIVSISGAQL